MNARGCMISMKAREFLLKTRDFVLQDEEGTFFTWARGNARGKLLVESRPLSPESHRNLRNLIFSSSELIGIFTGIFGISSPKIEVIYPSRERVRVIFL